ncbi:nucleoid-associated protein [Marinobacter sp. SS13-12]|uniref:nucleoid-associated protein n=1 Tax=Marinobacter sp. SS13-12 TaxID=3050451 RepID=UPI002557B2EC|nr:nucleoid-associated protein [Marinobacter sp. SS13-12]MDK8463436.1 nucleoid-associated protein [Marinobacter sp. SS13-12]
MEIKNIIIHEVDRTKATLEGSYIYLDTRDDENPIDEHSKNLVTTLSNLFRKTGLSSGNFQEPAEEDDDLPKLERLIDKYYNGESFNDFVAFSKSVARHLKEELGKTKTGKGGYLWLNFYEHNGFDFLSLVILRRKNALQIKDLSLDEIEEIDLDKLHMAARVNLTQWKESDPLTDRYIAFKIGRTTAEVTGYFREFIGCSETIKATKDTNNLVSVTKKYCLIHGFNDTKAENAKREVEELCLKWLDEGRPVYIDNISSFLDNIYIESEEDKGSFIEIAQNEPYNLNNQISIDRNALRKLRRYKGFSKKVSISFDSDLLGKTIQFNKGDKSLTFTELPEDLLQQLHQGLGDGD